MHLPRIDWIKNRTPNPVLRSCCCSKSPPIQQRSQSPQCLVSTKKNYISVNSVCSKQYVLSSIYCIQFIHNSRYIAQLLKIINLYRQNCLYDIHVYGLNNIVWHRTRNQSFYIQILPVYGIQKRWPRITIYNAWVYWLWL